MIKPLRTRHRWIIGILALSLLMLFAGALLSRQRVPSTDSRLLPGNRYAAADGLRIIHQDDALWTDLPLHTVFYEDTSAPGGVAVMLVPTGPIKTGDPLVYWLPISGITGTSPGDNAWLIGSLSNIPQLMKLPALFRSNSGSFMLYSLARSQVISVAAIPSLMPKGTR